MNQHSHFCYLHLGYASLCPNWCSLETEQISMLLSSLQKEQKAKKTPQNIFLLLYYSFNLCADNAEYALFWSCVKHPGLLFQQKPKPLKSITWNGSLLETQTTGLLVQSNIWSSMTLLFTNWYIFLTTSVYSFNHFYEYLNYFYFYFFSGGQQLKPHHINRQNNIVYKFWPKTTQV